MVLAFRALLLRLEERGPVAPLEDQNFFLVVGGLFLFLARFKLWTLLATLVAALVTARKKRKVHS